MQNKRTHWTMRASPQDRKMLADVAKHYHCPQARIVKSIIREIHAMKIAGRKVKQLSPAA